MVCFSIVAGAQAIVSDSRSNDVFNAYRADNLSQEVETGKDELSLSYPIRLASFFNYVDGDPTNKKTISKSYALLIKLKVNNSEGNFNINKNFRARPGGELEIGFQKTLDTVHNIGNIPLSDVVLIYGISAFASLGNFDLHDTLSFTTQRQHPVSFGLRGNFAMYKIRWMATQLSASYTLGWNTEDLPEYQTGTPIYNRNGYIAFDEALGGRLGNGALKSQSQYTASFANPFFPFSFNNYLGRIFISPYITVAGNSSAGSPDTYPGIMIGLLENAITGTSYNFDKGFGIGLDFKNGKDATLFFRGTISL